MAPPREAGGTSALKNILPPKGGCQCTGSPGGSGHRHGKVVEGTRKHGVQRQTFI